MQTGLAIFPCIITADTDSHHAAHLLHGHHGLVRINELIPHRLVSQKRFGTKKAVAFFNRSRSCRKISFSLRNLASSLVISGSGVVNGSASRSSRFHLFNVERPKSKSPAICLIVLPLLANNPTASRLNSAVNSRLRLIVIKSSCCIHATRSPSTFSG